MTHEEILKSFKNIEGNGRKLVELKRVAPVTTIVWGKYIPPVDTFDFKSDRIYANIPCWQDDKGNLTSLRTGKPVKTLTRLDQICVVGTGRATWGASFDYDDIHIICVPTPDHKHEHFVVRTLRDCEVVHHRAFGEELTAPPKANN